MLVPARARAEAPEPDGRFYVIAVEGSRLFVDLGRKDGISEQQILQVFKTGVSFDHPVKNTRLVGTTYLGDITVVEVSDVFSIAQTTEALLTQIKPGYEVRFRPQDAQSVQSARVRLRALADELSADSETWEQQVRRELIRFHGNNNKISAYTELVRFKSDDAYVRTQIDFTYRLFRGIYAVRFGLGGLDGVGEVPWNDEYDGEGNLIPDTDGDRVAYYFGYSSMEFRLTPFLSLAPVFQLGLNNQGVGYGIGTNLRVGPELGTNLVFTASIANVVGSQLALSYNHFINERLALSGQVAWENYVAGDSNNPSVRVLLGAHVELTKRLQLDVRGGLGGREVNSIGPSAMLGLSYNFASGLWWMQELEGR